MAKAKVYCALCLLNEVTKSLIAVRFIQVILPKSFYEQKTITLAKALLGTFLIHESEEGCTAGRIVETEAYLFRNDPACHAARGRTPLNSVMFGPAGFAYVYFIYGMYHCFNVVSGKKDEGEAVLIRALEPLRGIEIMKQRRRMEHECQLCNGPAKLVMALGIGPQHNGCSLRMGTLKLHSHESFAPFAAPKRTEIVQAKRIGIKEGCDLPLRFLLKDSPFVSKRT